MSERIVDLPTGLDWLDTPEAEEVLGLMNFQTGPLAHAYQVLGEGPVTKSEAEQAFMLRKFLKLVRDHGPQWRARFFEEFDEIRARIEAKRAAEEAPREGA